MTTMDGMPVATTGLRTSFKAIYDFTGKSLSAVTKFEKWELKDNESDLLADQTDIVVLEFFPQVSSKWGKLVALFVSFIAIFGAKWLSYEKDQTERLKKIKLDNENKDKTEDDNILKMDN